MFIGSSTEGKDLAYALQKELSHEADVTVWTQGVFQPSGTALDDLLRESDETDLAIFVFSPSDTATIRGKAYEVVRDNVLFELGLFVGKLGKQRNFFVVPRGQEQLRLANDLAGVTPLTYDENRQDNLQAAVGPACYDLRQSIKRLGRLNRQATGAELMIYDSAKDFDQGDFRGIAGYHWKNDERVSRQAKGSLRAESDTTLRIDRDNTEGRFEIHLRRDGPNNPSMLRKSSVRKLRVSFEARAEGGDHTLRVVFKDEQANKWADSQTAKVRGSDWVPVTLHFRVPPTVDLLFRIDDEEVSQVPSSVMIRKLVIAEQTA